MENLAFQLQERLQDSFCGAGVLLLVIQAHIDRHQILTLLDQAHKPQDLLSHPKIQARAAVPVLYHT